jgi:transposase
MPAFEYPSEIRVTISDELWAKITPILPLSRRKNRRGRPRMNDRQAMSAIWYKLQTGCSWKSLPRQLGAGSTVHDRYREWLAAGVFDQLRQSGMLNYEQEVTRI